uniref:Polyprotein allergen nematode domain-containing protein n=1 Tax=Panagrolaimus sp. ES5 TaxID=591445 RepID=A0AC34GJV9_9BILA
GASDSEVAKKIDEFIAALTDEAKKAKAEEYKADCKKIWGVQARKRRTHDHGNHDLEDYFKNHYSWLSDEQKEELRQMKKDGKKDDIWTKALEFYDAATGETKEKAKELMQGGCRELIRVIVGNEKADELTAMKESGASMKDMDAKLQEYVGGVTEDYKKNLSATYGPGCRQIFGVGSRKRRDHHHGHKLEDYLKTHLSWLTTEQGEKLKTMKADGKTPSELQKKV